MTMRRYGCKDCLFCLLQLHAETSEGTHFFAFTDVGTQLFSMTNLFLSEKPHKGIGIGLDNNCITAKMQQAAE